MMYFTQETYAPSAKTISFIKQLAYSYRALKLTDGTRLPYCLN